MTEVRIKHRKARALWELHKALRDQAMEDDPQEELFNSIKPLNAGEEAFRTWARRLQLPPAQRNFRFDTERKWEIDFAWPQWKIGIEIDGGIWRQAGGAHTGAGHLRDMEKGNRLLDLGWRVYHFPPDECKNGNATQKMAQVLKKAVEP